MLVRVLNTKFEIHELFVKLIRTEFVAIVHIISQGFLKDDVKFHCNHIGIAAFLGLLKITKFMIFFYILFSGVLAPNTKLDWDYSIYGETNKN